MAAGAGGVARSAAIVGKDGAMLVRPATRADLPAVKALYDHQVDAGVATFDLEPPPLSSWEARLAGQEHGHHLLVVEDDAGGACAGYATSASYRARAAYARTRETSVYLAPGAGGRGLGRALYDDLIARLRDDGMHTLLAVIAQPNPASEALHRACGYERVGLLPEVGFKHGRWIDTAYWALRLGSGPDPTPPPPDS